MARYLIQSNHTPAECLEGLDEILAQGPGTLARYSFGCAIGDHSNHMAFSIIDAANAEAARNSLPTRQRQKATVTEDGSFTPEQIKSFHGAN